MAELRGLRERDERLARDLQGVGGGRFGRTGRETLRVSQEAYFHAIEVNGGQQNGRTVWDDPGFVSDMKRRHPHIVAPGEVCLAGSGLRTRFGRVTERVRYVDGRKVTERF